jgi:hypothetical protein
LSSFFWTEFSPYWNYLNLSWFNWLALSIQFWILFKFGSSFVKSILCVDPMIFFLFIIYISQNIILIYVIIKNRDYRRLI